MKYYCSQAAVPQGVNSNNEIAGYSLLSVGIIAKGDS